MALLSVVGALVGVPGRSTTNARLSGDEPQYLLSATSLFDDGDLDISDQIASGSYRTYHEVPLSPQSRPQADGRQVSPHDPLLPLLLALPMGVGGWVGAKLAMVAAAVATAVVTVWVVVRRFDQPPRVAVIVVGAGFASLPLAPYGSQVYPEMWAALALILALACLPTASAPRRRPGPDNWHGTAPGPWPARGVLAAAVALPWLSIKYAPISVVLGLAVLVAVDPDRREQIRLAVLGALAAIAFLVIHRWVYGGWTAYAAGDHFVETGEFSVVGTRVDLVGRSRRVGGLLFDAGFGLVPWAPLWGLLPMAVGAAIRRRRNEQGPTYLALISVTNGWVVATFVALTMHGWWVPGRQLVVVLPVALLLIGSWVGRSGRRLWLAAGLGALGVVNWSWLAIEAMTGQRTLIVDFVETGAPGYRAIEWMFPDGIRAWPRDGWLLLGWSLAGLVAIVVGFRSDRSGPQFGSSRTR